MTTGIYKIEALCPVAKLTGKAIYIGQSKNIEKRWKQHHKRFPPSQYSYEILMACDDQYLDFFEKAFIDGYDSHRNGLNRTIGGSSIKTRYPHEETKRKLSEALRGRPGRHTGIAHSEETRHRMSETARNRSRGTCPHCGKEAAVNMLVRWHGDSCKALKK